MRIHFTSVVRDWRSGGRAKVIGWTAAGVVLVLAVSLTWLSGRHLVRTNKGTVVIEKRFFCLKETFADIRTWTWNDAAAHPELCQAMMRAGYGDLLPQPPSAMEKAASKVREWRDEAVTAGTNAWQRLKAKYGKPEAGSGEN